MPVALCVVGFNFNREIKLFLITTLVIAISTLVLSFSKCAIMAFVFALIFLGFCTRKRYILFILLTMAVLTVVLPPFFKHSFNLDLFKRVMDFSSDAGAIDRKYLWKAAVRMFMHAPVFGVGLGTFMESYQRFWLKSTVEIAYAHNCYLQVLAETGIVGLSTFLLFLAIWFKDTLKLLFKKTGSFYYLSFLGMTIGLIAYLLNSFVDTNFYSLTIAVLFWFILGLQQVGLKILKNE